MKKIFLTALTAAVLIIGPVITAGAATTAVSTNSTNSTQSGLTYSGGGPARSDLLNGPDYYQSTDNPFHSN